MNGRNSDNTKILRYLGWEPRTPLRVGMRHTCDWIRAQMEKGNPMVEKDEGGRTKDEVISEPLVSRPS